LAGHFQNMEIRQNENHNDFMDIAIKHWSQCMKALLLGVSQIFRWDSVAKEWW
jgi:hypothetical protein